MLTMKTKVTSSELVMRMLCKSSILENWTSQKCLISREIIEVGAGEGNRTLIFSLMENS
jgi:hypothetical protein